MLMWMAQKSIFVLKLYSLQQQIQFQMYVNITMLLLPFSKREPTFAILFASTDELDLSEWG